MSKSDRRGSFFKFLFFLIIVVGILTALYLYFKPFELPFDIPEIPDISEIPNPFENLFTITEKPPKETTPEETPEEITTPEETTPSGGSDSFPEDSECQHVIVIDKAVEPTCTKTGLTEGKWCSVCGVTLVAQETVSAAGHILGQWITVKEATATEAGLKEGTCERCGEKETQIIIPGSVGLSFTLNDDGESYSVSGIGACKDSNIGIPTEYNGLPVTSIDNYAFYDRSFLTSIIIPDSVTSIGYYAFYNCKKLTSITIGNSVTSIGDRAFENCSSLTSITIPDSVTSIGGNAFLGCGKLIQIENGVRYVDKWVIGCDNRTTYLLRENTVGIGDFAFSHCSSLTSITIPDSVTSIGDRAFDFCSSLTSITIPDSVTSIGNYAFYVCTSLKSATIGNGVTSIGDFAFSDCSSLKSITIPESVTSIGLSAFLRCSSLTNIIISDSVTSIGLSAFSSCSSLRSVTFEGTVEQWNAITKQYNWDGSIPATGVVCSDGVVKLN